VVVAATADCVTWGAVFLCRRGCGSNRLVERTLEAHNASQKSRSRANGRRRGAETMSEAKSEEQ